MSDELKNVTLAANDMAREIERLREDNRAARASERVLQAQIDAQAKVIDRLRDELRQARAESAAARAQVLKDTAVDLVSGRLGVVWDEKLCEEVMEQGPFAFVAYAQIHIAEALKDKAKADAP